MAKSNLVGVSLFDTVIKVYGYRENLINLYKCSDDSRHFVPKNNLDLVDKFLRDKNIKKIEIIKVVDYVQNDLF